MTSGGGVRKGAVAGALPDYLTLNNDGNEERGSKANDL